MITATIKRTCAVHDNTVHSIIFMFLHTTILDTTLIWIVKIDFLR